ncbi:serine/threonine-protein kinase [Sandaracinus amylolyticus]|uniref:Serine/threonine protein kinase n=1 Tax=Sandaracinus amylolyticus TaxID=927083 RepID=A0A0F6YMN0_9BACT|nr:serine/threonine-protein kinase [Sandaracinus amylolyticus]AKF10510.1 serine/threonine protein kinase [Sandaracinus amylolyticus]
MSDAPALEKSVFAPVRIGDVVAARYRVTREIGAGGMGQVLEVEHVELEKRFALKLVRPDRWDATLDARFRREARALAKVTTARVPQITDFGVDPGCGPFYVMELVDGTPLDVLLAREGPLPRERALELAIGIAEALVDVHAAGIVHRDVKPSNLGVCRSGPVRVRLLDFGLATGVDERFGSKITESRSIVGSLPYMAPEQFHGERPTVRVDLWALGVILYEMLTGALPFEAPSTAALMHQILYAPVPSSHDAPRSCGSVLAKLLAKDAGERPASASEAIELLEGALARPSSGTSRSSLATRATAPDFESSPEVRSSGAAASGTIVRPSRDREARIIAIGIALALAGIVAWGASVWLMRRDAITTIEHEAAPAPSAAPEPASAPTPEPVVVPSAEPVMEPAREEETAPATVTAPEVPRERAPRQRGRAERATTTTADTPPATTTPATPPSEPATTWDGTIIEQH